MNIDTNIEEIKEWVTYQGVKDLLLAFGLLDNDEKQINKDGDKSADMKF